MMKNLLISLGLFLGTVVAVAQPELKGTATELAQYLNGVPRIVALRGEAELKQPADRAQVLLRVVTESKSLQEASRLNQEARARMLRTLAERGVPAERVQAAKFSSTPKYGVFSEKAKSYRVDNLVKISATDEKEFQASPVSWMPGLKFVTRASSLSTPTRRS